MSYDKPVIPDVDRLAWSMLLLHSDHDKKATTLNSGTGFRPKPRDFDKDRQHGVAVRQASFADREHYLTSGLQPVECRFCHAKVTVNRLGPGHTAIQWNTEASQCCTYFAEVRESGGDTARTKSCLRLADSIEHAIAEGYLDRRPDNC
ncbi:hypothetical protein MUBE_06110 [Mycobacterium uberis]|uniref:Uncharacterized protein n=1 Tax=Mycobacterium uberis TaxID=2162698 RepID=A0A3E1HHU8_9MYCO|nr:hypothetical protein [Mycobacterium uberis]RFD26030.1 hypothetical protein MUBE_06110 [Mycobacterium uberis]